MDDDQLGALGAAVRRARGAVTQSEAARRSGVSRQWWIDIERGQRVPRADMLAQALIAVGAPIEPVFELAGLDPRPYLEQQERWRAARGLGGEIAPVPAIDDDELRQLDADILGELRAIRTELRRLGDVYEQLAMPPPAPPVPAPPSPRPARRAARRAAPASE